MHQSRKLFVTPPTLATLIDVVVLRGRVEVPKLTRTGMALVSKLVELTGDLFRGDVHLTKPKCLHGSLAQRSSAIENLIELNPIEAVPPGKSNLIAFLFNCSS